MSRSSKRSQVLLPFIVIVACVPIRTDAADTEADLRGFQSRVYVDRDQVAHKYVLFIPHKYDRDNPAPVILFLHGAGEKGTNGIEPILSGLGPAVWRRQPEFPFFVIFPQCEVGKNWLPDAEPAERALDILRLTQKEFGTDPNRVYLTGISMGGKGTWAIAAKHPDLFAAIVPIASRNELGDAQKLADAHLPIWDFCGDQDEEKTVTFSREMHAALEKAGAQAKYTEYPGVGHICWNKTYSTPELYEWLLEQKRPHNPERN